MDRCIVQFVVEDSSSVVFNGILDGGDKENNDERDGTKLRIGCTEDGKYLAPG